MNRSDLLTDELIQAAFERRAGRADPVGLRDEILGMTAASNQPAAWRLRLASAFSLPVLRPAWVALFVLVALLGIALAVALIGQPPPPSPFRTGLLAYTQDGDLYLANADGSDPHEVVHDPGVVFSAPTWSPDDRWLALGGSGAVFIFDPSTLELRRLATGEASVWSSDSRSLAFVKPSIGGTGIIEIVGIDTAAVRDVQPNLAAGASLGTPLVWSPDGRWFLARVNAPDGVRFVRIDAMTGDMVEIAPMHHLAEHGAHWSSDSRRFAFARPDPCDNPPCQSSIVVEDADLSRAVAISDPENVSSNPIWSPDDAWIAFISRNPGGFATTSTLSIVRPDGRDLRALAETAIFADSLSWSADGTTLAFSMDDPGLGVGGELIELRISDGVLRPVALTGGVDGYDWQSVASDRSVLALPTAVSPASVVPEAIEPLRTPPGAPAADPSGEWSGLAVDSYCDAGILDLRTLTPRMVGSRCPNSDGDVAFAPRAMAYAISRMDGSVTLVRGDGTKAEILPPIEAVAPGAIIENQLAWSPDGRWLSVRRCGQDCIDPEFIVLSPDGRSLRPLPSTPSWSPDGQRLAVQGDNGDLLVGSPGGENLRSVGTIPMPSSWSPDGMQLAFIRDGDAWIVNADGTAERNATDFVAGGVVDAIWSPDGRFIAVFQQSQLQILTLETGELLPIDLGPGRESFFGVRWSPDGARLAVVLGPGETPATMIIQTDGWTATTLGGPGIHDITWSPDGRFIALLDRSVRAGQIDVANGDGSGRHTIWTASDGSSRITWVP